MERIAGRINGVQQCLAWWLRAAATHTSFPMAYLDNLQLHLFVGFLANEAITYAIHYFFHDLSLCYFVFHISYIVVGDEFAKTIQRYCH